MIKIEEVARAICATFYGSPWDETSNFRQGLCRDMARAAIEAMRAPTPEITKAVCETLDGPNKDKARARIGAWLEAHHAAIDAALAEGPK